MTEGKCPPCTQTIALDAKGLLVEHDSLNGLPCPGFEKPVRRCETVIDNKRTGYRLTLWLMSDNAYVCRFDVRNTIPNRSDVIGHVVAYGSVKWDGCLNVMLDEDDTKGRHNRVMHHACSGGEWGRLLTTLDTVYDAAWDMFDQNRPEDDALGRSVADWERGADDESHLFLDVGCDHSVGMHAATWYFQKCDLCGQRQAFGPDYKKGN